MSIRTGQTKQTMASAPAGCDVFIALNIYQGLFVPWMVRKSATSSGFLTAGLAVFAQSTVNGCFHEEIYWISLPEALEADVRDLLDLSNELHHAPDASIYCILDARVPMMHSTD